MVQSLPRCVDAPSPHLATVTSNSPTHVSPLTLPLFAANPKHSPAGQARHPVWGQIAGPLELPLGAVRGENAAGGVGARDRDRCGGGFDHSNTWPRPCLNPVRKPGLGGLPILIHEKMLYEMEDGKPIGRPCN